MSQKGEKGHCEERNDAAIPLMMNKFRGIALSITLTMHFK